MATGEIATTGWTGQTALGFENRARSGHLGGKWLTTEERWFQVADSKPVQEGDLTLGVARLLAMRLRDLGANVSFIRNGDEPTTGKRPDDFRELARKILIKNGVPQPRADVLDPTDPAKEQTIRWQSEILVDRYSEIRRRAALVNFKMQFPDLVLCLHFNAKAGAIQTSPKLDGPQSPSPARKRVVSATGTRI